MKALTIINQLGNLLPKYTDFFNETVSSTISRTGTTATVTTSSTHNLSTGDYVFIKGAEDAIGGSVVWADDVATFTTDIAHDLTENFNNFDIDSSQCSVDVTGVTPVDFNGDEIAVTSVANRRTFTYAVDLASAPTISGTARINDGKDRGTNGLKQITVVDSTTVTYEVEDLAVYPQGAILLLSNFRISGAATLDRALSSYTKHNANKFWCFVVLGATTASKSRSILNDASNSFTTNDEFRIRLLKNFFVYVFAPCADSISARSIRDDIVDVEIALYKSLAKWDIPTPFSYSNNIVVTPIGNNVVEYNAAFVIQEFEFEAVFDIVEKDGVDINTVAFRNIEFNHFGEDVAIGIDLDDEIL